MKMSFESPLCLLEKSFEYNDYEFILYHLIDKYKEYKEYVEKSKKLNRFMIMDNSAYELGENYNLDHFAKHVFDYKPDYFILPDVFNDYPKTIFKINEFFKNNPEIRNHSKSIGVVQGRTMKEMMDCYENYGSNGYISGIAFNFKSELYLDAMDLNIGEQFPKNMKYSIGRKLVIDEILKKSGFKYKEKHHHLLGIILPQDVMFYKNYNIFKTIDTSNPVLHGMLGIEYELYFEEEYAYYGLTDKNKTKMDSLMENTIDEENILKINYNIEKFKENIFN